MIYIYQVFVILLALDNAKRIKEDKRIYHGLNGGLHIAAALLVWYFTDFLNAVSLFFLTRVVFDISLNLFRGLGIDYVSPSPKSIVDQYEKKLFGTDGISPKIVYILILICLQTLR